MCPYLKGFDLTIDLWRPGHDIEGWKDMNWYEDYPTVNSGEAGEEAPEFVTVVPHL
jgi:hypothetical protein